MGTIFAKGLMNERLGYKNPNKRNKCTLAAIMCIFYSGPDIGLGQCRKHT